MRPFKYLNVNLFNYLYIIRLGDILCLIPAGLNLDTLSINDRALKWNEKERISVLLNLLIRRRQTLRDKEKNSEKYKEGYVSMNSEILRSYLGNYNGILQPLINQDIIQTKLSENGGKSYQVGGYASSYRINPNLFCDELNGSRFRKVKITSKPLLNAFKRVSKIKETENEQVSDITKRLIHYNSLLIINEEEALDQASIIFEYEKQRDTEWLITSQAGIMLFNNRDYYTVCDFSRHHHKLSNLNKSYKKYVYFEGYESNTYGQCDVKAMQPYLLASLLTSRAFLINVRECINPELLSIINSVLPSDNLQKLFNDCAHGLFWTNMLETLKKPKSQLKKMTLAVLYGRYVNEDSEVYQYLNSVYPDLMSFIIQSKAVDYKCLAHSLQRVEGRIMYDNICPVIIQHNLNNNDEYPFATIHDCIFFPLESGINNPNESLRVNYIPNTMQQAFLILGLTHPPSISAEIVT